MYSNLEYSACRAKLLRLSGVSDSPEVVTDVCLLLRLLAYDASTRGQAQQRGTELDHLKW